jgi:hypothetical protein
MELKKLVGRHFGHDACSPVAVLLLMGEFSSRLSSQGPAGE